MYVSLITNIYLSLLRWSGTVFTRLVTPAYTAMRDEFRKRVGQNLTVTTLGGFDTCYSVPILAPTITFMFSGMNVTLPQDNLLIHSTAGSITCLAMAAAPDNVNSVLNVIANMQQQNHRFLFDVPNSRLGVAREPCSWAELSLIFVLLWRILGLLVFVWYWY